MLIKFNKSLHVILIILLFNFNYLIAKDKHVDIEEQNLDEATSNSNEQNEIIIEEINYKTPELDSNSYYLYEHFDDENLFNKRWIKSSATKADTDEYKYDGKWGLIPSNDRLKGDMSIVMESKARHHAISSKLNKPFKFNGKNLVIQYEVQFKNGQECGGAYIKLLSSPSGDLNKMNDKTPYTIMFGPDKCGNDFKLHFIFMHKNPKNKTLREIHWSKSSGVNKLDEAIKDGKWHLFRLTVRPDNSFEIMMDKRTVGKGSLLTDFNPPINPPKEIDDPNDIKPEDWDEREKIADPDAFKPDDWNEEEPRKIVDPNAKKPADWLDEEQENIPDPDASKPSDWDPEMDGEWEPPLISNPKCSKVSGCGTWNPPLVDNPKYKGKWRPPLISNPNFKGKWSPRKIANPEYFEDLTPYKMTPIDAVAFELWTISNEIVFDNVLLTEDVDLANYLADTTFQIKKELLDAETDNWFVKQIKYTNKNPWLWAVYLIAFAIPLVLFIGYCCVTPGRSSKKETPEESTKPKVSQDFKHGISGDEVGPMKIDETEKSQFVENEDEVQIDEVEEIEVEEEVEEEEEEERYVVKEINEEEQVENVQPDDEEEEEAAEEETEETENKNDELSKPRLRKHRARKEN